MKKSELLELEANAHLSVAELRTQKPHLTDPLDERVEQRARAKVAARLAGRSEKLRKLIENIKLPVGKETEKLRLRDAVLTAAREAVKADKQLAGDAALAKELEELASADARAVAGAKPDATLGDSLRVNEPVASHGAFRKELEAAKLFRLSDATGLGDRTAELLIKEVGKPAAITGARLETLVKDGKLTDGDADAIGAAASLYNILDERPELVAAARAAAGSDRDLVKLDKAAWTALIAQSQTKTPGRISADAYADLLARKVKRLFPTDALAYSLSGVNVNAAFGSDAPRAALANRFAGMKIREVMDETAEPDAQREAEVRRRVDLVNRFFTDNQDVLGMDLTSGSSDTKQLTFDAGASERDKAMVLSTARMYQRTLTVTNDITDAESLVAGGYPSALSVAMSRPKEIAARTGMTQDTAAHYHAAATGIAAGVTARAGTVLDLLGGPFVHTPVGNLSPAIEDYLKEIPGYADFFGDQSFCHCKHCQSILGPAAYFVDLMCFVDETITQEFFAGNAGHPLNLKTRRPDLWTLNLTCENTNTPIPYLVVINEILENAVARDAGFAGSFADRVAVERTVYRDTLPDRVDGFRQPLHLPFEELRAFIRHFQRNLGDMAEAGHATDDALARLRLGLAPKDFELITSQTNTGLAFLRRIYGVNFTQVGDAIQKFDAQLLLAPMGISRDELGELVKTRYVTANATVNISIVGEKRSAQSVQNDIENISGLTRPTLDRMHRFVRLWRATGWRMGELDLVLTHLDAAGVGAGLDAGKVRGVGAVHRMQTRHDLSVEDTVALWSTVPRHPVLRSLPSPPFTEEDAPPAYAIAHPLARLTVSLFDRSFNQKSFVEADGSYPKAATAFLHPALAAAPPAAPDPNLHRLLASLGATEDELLQLIVGLQHPLGIDPASGVDADKQFALTEGNLGLLFRHVRLARLLGVSLPELFAIAALADLADHHVASLADAANLLTLHAWVASTRWTIAELVRVRRLSHVAPPLPQPIAPDAGELAAALVAQVASSESLLLTETVFALLPPTSPVATSVGPVAGSAGGESVTYTAVLAGEANGPETIVLAANADLAAVMADWNAKATLTRAFRSDAAGRPLDTGTHLSITVAGANGSSTRIVVSASPAPLFPVGESRGAELTEAQSREVFAANANLFEAADARGRYRLKTGFDPHAPLVVPASVDAALAPGLLDLLTAFHSARLLPSLLSGSVGVDAARLPFLLAMLGVETGSDAFYRELRADVPPAQLTQLIEDLRPLALLFKDAAVFDADHLAFVSQQPALFEIADFRALTTGAIRNVETFRSLLAPWVGGSEAPPDLHQVLLSFTAATRFAAADQADLAALLDCDEGLLQSLTHIAIAATPLAALRQLQETVAFATHVGMGGGAIRYAQSATYADVAAASAALQAAFRAKYPDESEWEKKVEPFRDAILSKRRDGLVPYLLNSAAAPFDEVSDLYHYFLLDVELEGCARTSRVAAAIDTVQLYVHRCLMNLEETPPGAADPVHVLPESVPADEWAWRKNYRVWEATRKIFLYPENYIEPELRDDKTPLFKQLEEDLLSKDITNEAILEAYARYLRGFDELAHLTIAGSYHEKDPDAGRDVLHLCGVTADEPPTYYYRRVENAHYGATSDEVATYWGAWEKMNVQVPATKVSPVVHRGQLYVFWNRYTTKPKNEISGGASTFAGYEHRAGLEFSKRRVDGSWTAPQKISLLSAPFNAVSHPSWYGTGGTIADPIVEKNDTILGFKVTITIATFVYVFTADANGTVWAGSVPMMQLPPEVVATTTDTTYSEDGYQVEVSPIWETTLETPLYDTEPHLESKSTYTLTGFGWDRPYPGTNGPLLTVRGFNFQMYSAIDLYRLSIGDRNFLDTAGMTVEDRGVPWLNPGATVLGAFLIWLCTCGKVDLLEDLDPGRLVWSTPGFDKRVLHKTNAGLACFDSYTYASLLLDASHVSRFKQRMTSSGPWTEPQWEETVTDYLEAQLSENPIGEMPTDGTLDVVNGSVNDVIIQTARDAVYLQSDVRSDGKYHLRRLNTSLSEPIADTLFNLGLSELLATATQLTLEEQPTPLAFDEDEVHDATGTGGVDYNGSMGTYLREIYFHIPFLIADHLNSQGRFEDAQRWYHYIFDPTAAETVAVDPALSEEEQRVRALDRNWRYREFRNLTPETLRQQLTNGQVLEAYRRDPFNPHAVARLRLSAYQKAVLLKYVDNLIDWGDDLFMKAFSLTNPEYLREATLKYVTAQELLGERPALLGDCGEGRLSPRSFERIKPFLDENSEFLMEMESTVVVGYRKAHAKRLGTASKVAVEADRAALELWSYKEASPVPAIKPAPMRTAATARAVHGLITKFELTSDQYRVDAARSSKADFATLKPAGKKKPVSAGVIDTSIKKYTRTAGVSVGVSVVRQVNPIFCIPGNARMWAHWDRVADRLYKLRHCMDIEGVYRQLPLFAPPIDPRLLVAGRAAGLSVEDMLGLTAGALPPYRFRYLIDKARSYAATIQAFGGALLGALEKRDAEELTRLRNTQQKNMLALTTEVKRNELKIAEDGITAAVQRQAAAQDRYNYYDGLLSAGLTVAEIVQTSARGLATAAEATVLGLDIGAAVAGILPRVGSPFAMVYGGEEVSRSLTAWGRAAAVTGKIAELTATVAGIAAGFERRTEGWEHARKTAEHDLKSIAIELKMADVRQAIASRALELHEQAKDQQNEVIDFFQEKFSNLGLYTYLSRSLQQLHREAYTNALAMARLAEQAYRFERPGDTTVFVGGEWDASRSGLLAGERLNLALQNMEKRFIETNARSAEINQSFSVAQINPQALIDLKEIGSCEFELPEFFFDMFYPGQYRRRILAVRLTIPCITGPYTNVSARLTLLRSQIRRDAVLGDANLLEVPPGGTTSVATSTAQGDAGVFELSFRDERYMPFEGAGAVSRWRLELPSQFRPFDYQTINDVILNVSYTAEEDRTLRQDVESQNAAIAGSLLHFLSTTSLTRVFSLRQEFSSAFNRLMQAAVGTPVTIDITERHFPLFIQGRALTTTAAHVVLVVEDRSAAVGPVSISLNGTDASAFPEPTNPPAAGDPFGGLPNKTVTAAFAAGLKQQHSITVNDAGNIARAGGAPGLDPDKLRDVLVVVQYRL